MNAKDISTIRRFLGVVEGVSMALPSDTQSLLHDYMEEVVDSILNKEEEGNNDAG